MMRKVHVPLWPALSVTLICLLSSSSAFAVPLLDLLAGGDIVVGDKRFHNFRDFVSSATGSDPEAADPGDIDVDALIAGDAYGLRFSSATWHASATDGFFGPIGSQTTEFSYDVDVLGPQAIISGSLSYETAIPNISGESRVSATVRSLPSQGVIANTEVFTTKFDFNFSEQLFDQDFFAPQAHISIRNRIYVEDTGTTISEFSQTFRQRPVPEPATLLLVGAGLAAAVYRRRMKS